jgi:hypothetical protein
MKKYFDYIIIFFSAVMLLCLAGCKKAENIKASAVMPEKEIFGYTGGNSTLNRIKVVHLYRDTVYILSEPFTREAGEQLVIDEGTLIKVNITGVPLSFSINPGGVLIANGTKNDPIVFTANTPVGTQNKNWGGIILNGKSVSNATGGSADITDFSGSLKYVRIEFAGLILNKVGNTSLFENVQVSYSNPQSSFEIHGGTFNARNLLSYACGGPADLYITEGYSGKMQRILAYRHPFFGSPGTNPVNALAGVFIENSSFNPVNARPYTFPAISNLTVIGPNAQSGSASFYVDSATIRAAALVTTGSTGFRIRNSLLLGFPAAAWHIDDSLTAYGLHYDYSEFTHSIVHSNVASRAFYLKPGAYPPFQSIDFNEYMLRPSFNNQLLNSVTDFMFSDPFNYNSPDPAPQSSSPVLTGANFDGVIYSDPFFEKVSYKGAIGPENWLKGWTNFTPLKTSYNFPK